MELWPPDQAWPFSTMNLRQNGMSLLLALWFSTHAMQFPWLGHSTLGQLQLGLSTISDMVV